MVSWKVPVDKIHVWEIENFNIDHHFDKQNVYQIGIKQNSIFFLLDKKINKEKRLLKLRRFGFQLQQLTEQTTLNSTIGTIGCIYLDI